MERGDFRRGLLSMAVIAVLIGSGTVVGGSTSFAAGATPSGRTTAEMRVVELLGPAGFPSTWPIWLNNRGTTVGYAQGASRWQAVRWNRDGQVSELPGLGGGSIAVQINDRGVAIGHVDTPSDQRFPALWDASGRLTVLPSLPGHRLTVAHAINDHGTVAGIAHAEYPSEVPFRPVRWDRRNRVTALPLPPGFQYGGAMQINERGTIVGFAAKEVGGESLWRAVAWDRQGRVRLLETIGGWSSTVLWLNNRGEMLGRLEAPEGAKPVRWDRHGRITQLPVPPDTQNPEIRQINDHGIAVGSVSLPDSESTRSSAVRWDRYGRLSQLPAPNGNRSSATSAINNRGVIVGYAWTGHDSPVPAMWDRDGRAATLPVPPGYWYVQAGLINDHGTVVGWGYGPDDVRRGLLWRPA